jgi:Tfp pilus assembly pilus retraction ATPase PilT
MNIDDLLRIAMERRASDLHLKVGNYPHLRIDGDLTPLTDQPRISAEDMLTMAFSMMSARQKQKFKETTEIDMAYGVAGLGRFRVNVFQQRGNVGLVLRVIPTKIRALDELYLPKIVEQVCDMPRGLILVTGVTGSGKSTTLAAMVDRINSTRAEHIVTIEDPIEFLHRDKKGYVNQREVEVDTPSFGAALRASLRQEPDVILVDWSRPVRGGNRPHGLLYVAHTRRSGNHQPYYRDLSSAGTKADSLAAGGSAACCDQPTAGEALRRRWPGAGRGSDDQHRIHPRVHSGSGKDAGCS